MLMLGLASQQQFRLRQAFSEMIEIGAGFIGQFILFPFGSQPLTLFSEIRNNLVIMAHDKVSLYFNW